MFKPLKFFDRSSGHYTPGICIVLVRIMNIKGLFIIEQSLDIKQILNSKTYPCLIWNMYEFIILIFCMNVFYPLYKGNRRFKKRNNVKRRLMGVLEMHTYVEIARLL